MCFSANASFAASVALMAIGAVAMAKSRTAPQRVLAAIPVLFSLQQFTEGLVWISLRYDAYAFLRNSAAHAFLLFAQVIWPLVIPLCVWLLEGEGPRKRWLAFFLGTGIITALCILGAMLCYPMTATIDGHHIKYDMAFPLSRRWYYGLLYFIPTLLAPFISRVKGMQLLGAALVISYAAARIWYRYYVISVWCFFATVISLIALAIIIQMNGSIPGTSLVPAGRKEE